MELGLSISSNTPVEVTENINFIEIKKFTRDEVEHARKCMNIGLTKNISFHLQYLENGKYILPTIEDFSSHIDYFSKAIMYLKPQMISFHFGLSSKSVMIDDETFVAVTNGELLSRDEISENIKRNLVTLKNNFPETIILLENLEYIPELISKGCYSYIQEIDFFTDNLRKWHRMGIVDGMVLDISHAIIASKNHPSYNGYIENSINSNNESIDVRKLQDLTSKEYFYFLKSITEDKAFDYFKNYLSGLPIELIKEIHISGHGISETGMFVDAHLIPGNIEKLALTHILEEMKTGGLNIPPVVLEYTRKPFKIPDILEDLRETIKKAL